ncbi:Beta-ketoacyl synthase [Dothideomycetidae sp. 11243]|nr:Beta-ketoacyl synthase [fungal sp. No.11243]
MDADSSEWASEPIAVIGMSCKFSGGASNPDKLWELMASGKTGWSGIPIDRFDLKGVYHSNHERNSTVAFNADNPPKTHVKGGHFIDEDVAAFDAAFFNYSAEMAQVVDPQFRLQLESTYEALENAGLPLSQVTGSQTSVFAGVFTHDYQEGIIRDEDRLPRFNVVGTWSPMSSNRISHFFDFRGASMTLETGCSTTLVALHQAIQTLRNREADMSVVTGANVMLNPDTFKAIGSLGMLSPDGRSYAFDARANGYGRGEGVATIIIKRLSDALANNDPIRAVIRETALNQDGKTETITTPLGAAQIELMRECYRRAGLDPRGTQYFEAHGTGTQAGDPIEARAMAAIFGVGVGREQVEHFLRIGSIKTNVGHTEAASGLAAMIKGVLCLEKGLIPPSVNYETPNPKLKLDDWRLKVVTDLEQWPPSLVDGPRRISINNFGYGGANAHVILESADPWTLAPDMDLEATNGNGHSNGDGYSNGYHPADNTTDQSKILIVSARDERGCQQMIADLKAYLAKQVSFGQEDSVQLLENLSYTLGERRTLFQWVAAHQVRLEKDKSLEAVIQALESPRFKPGRRPSTSPRIGMIFTGQGAQWYAMGRELLRSYPVFRRSIDDAEAYLCALGADWSLLEELKRDQKTTKVHATNISIPVCVALQIGLVDLLAAWGITPSAVTSHSSGEIAAAYAVGALTHRQAMATAYYRALLAADETKRAPGAPRGAMAAVGLGAEQVQPYLDRLTKENGRAVIACVNSPQSVTISGDAVAVQEIEELCKQDGVFARRLKVQQAYHSHHMDPFAEPYREHLRKEMARNFMQNGKHHQVDAEKKFGAIFSSAVTGGRITDLKEIASPDHWVGSLVQPVLFVDSFTNMVLGDPDDPTGRSVDVLLEVGPHTALGGPIKEILSLPEFEGIELPYWGCLVRDEHAGDTMRSAAINLFREGLALNMGEINFPVPAYDDEKPRVLTDLPSYPWNHTMRHWQESRINRAIRERSEPPHELLGMPVAGNDPNMAVWRRILRVTETPWVGDHMVQGSIVYPGSGYICLAIEAANQMAKKVASEDKQTRDDISGFSLRDVNFLFALVIPDSADGVEIRTTLRPVPEREIGARGWQRFEVSSVTLDNRWTLHAKGMILAERQESSEIAVTAYTSECPPLSTYTRQPDPQDLFANLRARSVYHGPLFQNTTKIIQDGRQPRSLCDITIRHEASSDTDPKVSAENSVLHPITLDAIVVAFYSALPSVGALQEDPKLPRSVKSMWVSNDISREVGRTLRCDTSLIHDDAQSGTADITVLDGQSDATVLTVNGVEFASLGRGSGATARQDAANKGGSTITSKWEQEVCSKLMWGPDLSLRQPRALAQIKEQLSDVSTIDQIAALLRKLLHKNPSARILQVGAGAIVQSTRRILEALGTSKSPLFASWHLTDSSEATLEDARTQLADWTDVLEFDQLDIAQNPAKQKIVQESYDIVVAFETLQTTGDASKTAANLRGLLKPGGTLLMKEVTDDQIDTSDRDSLLRDNGLSGVDLEVRGSTGENTCINSIVISTLPVAEQQRPGMNDSRVTIVSSSRMPPPSQFIESLSRGMAGAGALAPEHLTLEDSSIDAYKDKICVFVGEIDEPILADLNEARMEGLRAMVTQCSGLLWLTTGSTVDNEVPERALSQGFLRVLRNEYIGRRYLSLDLDPSHRGEEQSSDAEIVVSAIVQVLEQGFDGSDANDGPAEFEYAERDGVLLIPRMYKDEQYNDMVTGPLVPSWSETNIPLEPLFQDERPLRLQTGIPGHLDTLAFIDQEEDLGKNEALAPELIEITPRAFGVSSRDAMAAMGQLKDRSMGFECAGIITRVGAKAQERGYSPGDHVMALSTGCSFASRLHIPWQGVVHMPSDMDFVDAASLPLAFTVAYAAFVDTAHLAAGQSVLVHAAAGAFGQAAIMLARHLGVTDIYVTAGSQEKRALLRREYGIPDDHIFNSRDASFAKDVLTATKGRGIDVVVNSLPGPLLQASLSAIAPLGHLIEIGKRDIETNSLVAMESFSHGISLTTLDVPTLLNRRGSDVHRILGEVSRLIEQQTLKAAHPVTVYPMKDVQAAFRFMQTGAQTGKIVLSAGPDETVHVVPRPRGATPRSHLRADASYLVIGGVGGIGRSVAHWLVNHGAQNLILVSRSAGDLDLDKNQTTDGALFIRELRAAGCQVKPVSCDIAKASSLAQALRACEDDGLPPVRGVIQGAMLLRDAVFEQMTLDDWQSGLRPKLEGTFNLHTEFSQPDSLDFFVMLSSVSGIVGIASQTNYAAGGSYEDAMARWRQSQGLPGVAIDLGPISDIGYVSTSAKVADRLRKDGDFAMLDEDIVLRALNAAILYPLGHPSQIIVGLNSSPGPQWDTNGRSQLGRDARFLPLRPRTKASSRTASEGDNTSISLSSQLTTSSTRQEGAALIGAAIAAKLADIFMTPVEEIDLSKPPAHYGVDSLIAVELRNMLVLQAAADVSIFNILQTASLEALAAVVAEKSRHLQGKE